MSNVVQFTEEDLKSGYQVQTPGFYDYEIIKHDKQPAKTDGSPNHIVTFLGQGESEMGGVRVTALFSSKAKFAYIGLFKAANGGTIEKGKDYNWDSLVGCRVKAWTKRGDRFPNELTDFRPVN